MTTLKLVADPSAPSGRGSVLSDIRNKNNQENLKLQKRIQEYDKELLLMVKGLDFEKLDLCEFLKNVKSCDSDKLSQFKEIQDEIRRTQKDGSTVPINLAQALVQTISHLTVDGQAVNLPLLLNQAPSRSTASASPVKSAKNELDLKKLPDLSRYRKEQTLLYIRKNAIYNKSAAVKTSRIAWPQKQTSTIEPKSQEQTATKLLSQRTDVNLPFVVTKPDSHKKKPKSIVQRKRRFGTSNIVRSKTISFEDQELDTIDLIKQSNLINILEPTATPNHLQITGDNIESPDKGVQNFGSSKHEQNGKTFDRLRNKRPSLDSDALLTKTASVFAQQARFYSDDDSDALDLTLGLPKRDSPAKCTAPQIDIETIQEEEDINQSSESIKSLLTPIRTPQKSAVVERRMTLYDMVVQMNKGKAHITRQISGTESMGTNKSGRSTAAQTPSSGPQSKLRIETGSRLQKSGSSRGTMRRTAVIAQRVNQLKITLPMLLSMGVGELRDPRKDRYQHFEYAARSVHANPTVRAKYMQSRNNRMSRVAATEQDKDDDSYYSDSNYYDSDDSYDMKLLEHKKKRKRISRKSLNERIQYLYDDIMYFTTERKKNKMNLISF